MEAELNLNAVDTVHGNDGAQIARPKAGVWDVLGQGNCLMHGKHGLFQMQ